MKPLPFVIALLCAAASGCVSTRPISDESVVASELSVVRGRNPVLFAGRTPDDGEWILLTDERAGREVVVYALFQEILAFDSTLAQVRDLPVGWKATRWRRGAPWVREKYSLTQQVPLQPKEAAALDKLSQPKSTTVGQYFVTLLGNEGTASWSRQISVQEKRVNVWHLEGDSEAQTQVLLWSDTLATATQHLVDSLVQRCELDTLKDVYGAPIRQSGTKFLLSFWDVKKERSTSSLLRDCWVPSLYELCVCINSLLPRSYAMDLTVSKE